MFNKSKNILNMLSQARNMQKGMREANDQLSQAQIQAASKDGRIRAVITGTNEPKTVTVDPSVREESVETIARLILELYQDGRTRSEQLMKEQIMSYAGGLGDTDLDGIKDLLGKKDS